MKKISYLILLVFTIISCDKKNKGNYNLLIAEARSLSATGQYEKSGKIYDKAFAVIEENDSLIHHYEAARAWALAGEKDLAFNHLFEISDEGNYSNLGQLAADMDLNSLSTDERWMILLKKVSENKKEAEAELAEVASLLEVILYDDQKYRQELAGLQEKYGRDSEEVLAHWKVIEKQDSINLTKVEKVLGDHGWLGRDQVGRDANKALFLVIQHADIKTQKKYLPQIRKAVKKGDAAPTDLAILEDRIALRQGKKQIYGSQIGTIPETGEYYLRPLHEPHHVNQRRAAVGLEPIEDYISYWNLTWDAEAYKEKLPELEAMEQLRYPK